MLECAPTPATEKEQRYKQEHAACQTAFHQHLHVAIFSMRDRKGAGIVQVTRADVLMGTSPAAQEWKIFDRLQIRLPHPEAIVQQLVQGLIASQRLHSALEGVLASEGDCQAEAGQDDQAYE